MKKKLSLRTETLRDLTPGEALAINGGAFAQPTSTVRDPRPVMPVVPVAQPTSTVRPTRHHFF